MVLLNNGDQSAGPLDQRSMKDVAESIGVLILYREDNKHSGMWI